MVLGLGFGVLGFLQRQEKGESRFMVPARFVGERVVQR